MIKQGLRIPRKTFISEHLQHIDIMLSLALKPMLGVDLLLSDIIANSQIICLKTFNRIRKYQLLHGNRSIIRTVTINKQKLFPLGNYSNLHFNLQAQILKQLLVYMYSKHPHLSIECKSPLLTPQKHPVTESIRCTRTNDFRSIVPQNSIKCVSSYRGLNLKEVKDNGESQRKP